MSELKPCPFCGGSDLEITPRKAHDDNDREYAKAVHCRDCMTVGPHEVGIGWCETDEEAVEAWNRRAPIAKEGVE